MVREIAIGAADANPFNYMQAPSTHVPATVAATSAFLQPKPVKNPTLKEAEEDVLLGRTASEEEQVISDDLDSLVVDDQKFMQT